MRISALKKTIHQTGFSLPEVIFSAALLSFLIASAIQLFMKSGITIRTATLSDAAYALIADDLANLKSETWKFACEDGTEGGFASSCTGNPNHADVPVAYKTGRKCTSAPCEVGELVQISALTDSCTNNNMASYMSTNHKNSDGQQVFAPGTKTLDWEENLPSGIASQYKSLGIVIQREISVNSTDQNQIDVTYTSGSPLSIKVNSSLVPQALSWCP